ncbi:uncharacterized protein LOC131197525 [Ahaetulla prasina]|uniref:uncharacterized protein LOC131197525 n=1 Tax=Ahaetulla prasina TaxID=499056 RepID=UPI00264839AC|nr:uncharacterized protein LOC131197525 [Ahaetulla prasina]
MIAAAVQRGITASRQTQTHSWVSDYAASQTSHDLVHDYTTTQAEDFQVHSPSQASLVDEGDLRDQNLSEDEDLVPDQPSFVGLFNPQLFRSLLHKAKVTTRLGVTHTAPDPTSGTTDPPLDLFSVPVIESEEVPAPKLFVEVVDRQWTTPIAGPNPNALDRRLYNLDPNFLKLLQIPTVDAPVVALAGPSVVTGPPEETLLPEDKRAEQTLVKSHQAAAWAVRASSSASFFNRAALLWLKQLRDHLPVTDTQSHQDLNKIIAAIKYSADATLNASRFAAKSIGSTVSSHRLLWLRRWQTDAKNKWQLASAPYSGTSLFGAALDPLLVETKDKCKILPSMSRCSDSRPAPYFRPFRMADSNFGTSRTQRSFSPRQGRQDRQGGQVQRGSFKRPFRGGRGRPFRRLR